MAFRNLAEHVPSGLVAQALDAYGNAIVELGWHPGDRQKGIYVDVEAMAALARA